MRPLPGGPAPGYSPSVPRRRTLLLLAIALLARTALLGWDAGLVSPHPDERQVGFVAERLEGWGDDPEFYAYGSLHFYLLRLLAAVTGTAGPHSDLIQAGRLLSLVASMAALALGWRLARQAWGGRTADWFLALAVLVPLDLQQSHYATVEAHHAAWVMAALGGAWWLGVSGRGVAAVVLGVATGASLAVKVSSLSLGLVVVLAAGIATARRPWPALPRLLATAAAAAAAAFWICQPSAFVGGRPPLLLVALLALAAAGWRAAERLAGARWRVTVAAAGVLSAAAVLVVASIVAPAAPAEGPGAALSVAGRVVGGLSPALAGAYLDDLDEQVAMVTGASDLPYVRVYRGTVPVLYPLRELALWGFGPALLAAAAWATARGCRVLGRRWRRLLGGRWSGAEVLLAVLLAWVVPMALRLATLEVKFLRYWAPLVVPAALLAAWALVRLRRPAVTAGAVAITLLWGVMYLWTFADPHPHRTAGDWLGLAAAPGDVVAFEHWDETLEVLPEDGGVSLVRLPSYELPDDGAKVAEMLAVLEQADWVALTSHRVRRTVLANPERYPRTGRLYRLLLAGEAGFEIATTASRGPRLLGIRMPVQRADESFVNYEMPRVVLLRRVAAVDADRLAERVARPLPYLEGLDAAGVERLLVDPAPAITPVYGAGRQLAATAVVASLMLVCGAAAWLLLLPVLRGLPDAGVGLALATGWLVPAWTTWMGSEAGVLRVGPASASWVILAGLAAAAALLRRRAPLARRLWRRRRRTMVAVLAAGAVVLGLFLLVRAFNPAVHWGEKPMDFAFLNAFLRAEAWPPGEPWLAGMPLHYYYFGEILAAMPLLAGRIPPAVGYNLMAAVVPAVAAVVLAGLGAALAGRRRRVAGAVLLPGLVLLTGNLAWPWLLDLARSARWFDLWWATSRVIPGFAITEYPLWTALFADLHGHFLALPVLVTALAWGLVAVVAPDRRWLPAAAGCGLAVAVLAATNPWDLLLFAAALGLGALVATAHRARAIARLTAAAAISLVAAAPFVVELVAGIGAGAGGGAGQLAFLTRGDFAPWWAVLRHFGALLLPVLAAAVLGLGRDWKIALPLAAVGVLTGVAFGSGAAGVALGSTVVLLAAMLRARPALDRLALALGVVAMLGVAAAERFTIIDRMNTIFKLYNGIWVLLAASLAILLLAPGGPRRRAVLLAVWLPLEAVALVNLPLGAIQGWVQPRMRSPRPTLDGQAFLRAEQPEEWFAVRVVGAAARPGDAVAEAAGEAYGPYTRIAMHTGVPTVVGWPWHLQQRGHGRDEVDARYADLAVLYSDAAPELRRRILDRYRVGWIVLTPVERRTYGVAAADPFAGVPGVLRYAGGERAAVYRAVPATEAASSGAAAPPVDLPDNVRPVGTVAGDRPARLVAQAAAADGGVAALLWNGVLVEYRDGAGQAEAGPPPPCAEPILGDGGVVACPAGELWRLDGDRWRRAGTLPAGASAAAVAGDGWWSWGPAGAWRRGADGDSWRQAVEGQVTALAWAGGRIAFSDGERVVAGADAAAARPVPGVLDGVRRLAWRGPSLWALDAVGLHRSGGGVLPWRAELEGLGDVVSVAGSGDGTWLVRAGGELLEVGEPPCRSPWRRWPEGIPGTLREPRGIAASPDGGWLAVADSHGHRVVLLDPDGGCLDTIGGSGEDPGRFREPSGVAVSADGTVAVTDTWNGRVQLLPHDGPVLVLGGGLYGPRAVVFAPDGGVLVADTGNKRVVRFAPPDWRQETVARFEHPAVGLAWAGDLLAVAVPDAGVVALVSPDTGVVERTLEVPGWRGGGQQEGYLAVLPAGGLVATAPRTGGLWRLDPSGRRPPQQVAPELSGLTGIAVLPDGRVVASQTWEHRLVRLEPAG